MTTHRANPTPADLETATPPASATKGVEPPGRPREIGGPTGPEPTRYGDWERRGRCIDF
jgi:hypothetical protein